jgi:hypothetical protein
MFPYSVQYTQYTYVCILWYATTKVGKTWEFLEIKFALRLFSSCKYIQLMPSGETTVEKLLDQDLKKYEKKFRNAINFSYGVTIDN